MRNDKSWQSGSFLEKSITLEHLPERLDKTGETVSTIPLMEGWPIKIGFFPESPVAVDLTGDGKKEVIIADGHGRLHVFTCHGAYLSEVWPMKLGNELAAPTAADVDQDGELEIIVVARSDWENQWPNGWVHVLKISGEYVPGWPSMLDGPHGWINMVSIGDINRDGRLNIITATGSVHSSFGINLYKNKLYAFHPDGTLLPGWPAAPSVAYDEKMIPRSPLVLVDLDQDGYLEIISGFLYSPDPNGSRNGIFALNHDGTIVSGFPIINEDWNYGLASADMDNDGVYEIYSMARRYTRDGYHDPTWNMNRLGGHKLAFADVNNDGYPEIIYGSDKVYVVDKDGDLLPGWPQYTLSGGDIIDGNPIAGDITGDGNIEILIGSHYTNKIYAWHHNGSQVDGFPLTTGGSNKRIAISDLDGDGSIELISACSDSFVYVWNIPSSGPCTRLEWPMYQRDQYRTGTYPSKHGTPVIEEPGKAARSFRLEQNYPNPFNSQTTIRFHLETGINRLSLHLFNVRGELIRTLSENRIFASGFHEILWDGKSGDGVDAPSGLYLVVMRDGRRKEMRKVLLVR